MSKMHPKLWLGTLGLILLTGGISIPVAADTAPSIQESEKVWGDEYPKLSAPIELSNALNRNPSAVLDSRGRLHILGGRYLRQSYESRGPSGFEETDPYLGVPSTFPNNLGFSPSIVMGTDDIARGVISSRNLFDETSQVYAEILKGSAVDIQASRILIPEPSIPPPYDERQFGASPHAAIGSDGKIHVVWSRTDLYLIPMVGYREIARVFYARVSQGDPVGGSPMQVETTQQIYESPHFPLQTNDLILASLQIQVDPVTNALHVAWFQSDYTPSSTYLSAIVHMQGSGGGWSSPQTIVQYPAWPPSLATYTPFGREGLKLKSDGSPAIVYGKNGDFYYAEQASGWNPELLPSAPGLLTLTPSLAFDASGQAFMTGYDYDNVGSGSNSKVFLWRRRGAGMIDTRPNPFPDFQMIPVATPAGNLAIVGRFHVQYLEEDNLGSQDGLAMASDGRGASFNVANGNQIFSLPLFSTNGRGFASSIAFTYNSLEHEEDFGLSRGWRHNLQMHLDSTYPFLSRKQLVLHRGDGSRVVFVQTFPGSSRYLAEDRYGDFSRIEPNLAVGDTAYPWVLTDKYGMKYGFGVSGIPAGQPGQHNKLRRVRDTNGNELNLAYGDNPLTAGVTENNLLIATDSVDREISFDYTVDNQVANIVFQSTGRTFTMTYDATAAKHLASVEDSAHGDEGSHIWQFEYHTTNDLATFARKGLLSKVIPPKGSAHAWQYGYQTDNRFVAAQDPDGHYISCEYTDPENGPYTATLTDRNGNPTVIESDFERSLAMKITLPEAGDGAVPIVRTFDQFRNELTFADARGNTTTKTYIVGTPDYVKDNLATVQRPGNDAAHRMVYSYTADGFNHVASITAERKAENPITHVEENVVTTFGYDAAGNQLTKVHPHASTDPAPTEISTYDNFGRILTFQDPNTHLTAYGYGGPGDNGTGLVTSITRPNTLSETFAYDVRGNRTGYTSMAGGSYTYAFDLRDRQIGAQEPGTPASATAYDLHDLVVDTQDPRGFHTTFTYDLLDRLDEARNALWTGGSLHRIKRTYDPNGNTLTRSDLKDQIATTAYDARNRPATETSPNPGTGDSVLESQYAYDGNSNAVTITRKGGGFLPDQVTTMQYDVRNNATFTTHPTVSDLEAPPAGSPTTVASAVHIDETRYDESDLSILSRRTSNGAFKTASGTIYDFRGLPRETRAYRSDPDLSLPSFIAAKMEYDLDTNLTKSTDPDNRSWVYGYDNMDRQVSATDARNVMVSRTVYTDRITGMAPIASSVETLIQDPALAVASPQPTLRSILRNFDLRGDLIQTRDVLNQATAFVHDPNHNLTQSVDAANHAVEQAYDALNRQVSTTTHPTPFVSLTTSYVLDPNGSRLQVQDPRGNIWRTDFDALSRPIKATNPGSNTFRTMAYNAFGLLRQSIDEGGQTRTRLYDNQNRPTQESISGGVGGSQTLQYFHDGADRRTKEMASLGMGSVCLHRFDALSRQTAQEDMSLVGATLTPIRTLNYTYTNAGDPLNLSTDDPALGTWTYAYNEDHQLQTLSHSSGEVHGWTYDPGMRQKTHAMPNGCVETRTYDPKERLQRMLTRTSSSAVLADLQYGFDPVDNRTSINYAHLGGTQSFAYDGTYRLMGETRTGGIPVGSSSWQYDGAGNRTLKTENGQTTTSVYDAENRLISETVPGNPVEILRDKTDVDSKAQHYKEKPLDDGLTPDSTSNQDAWASKNQAGAQHWALLEFKKGPKNVSRVSVWLPTVQGLVQRFRIQYLLGNAWLDLPNPQVAGAVPSATPGWYRQTAHRVDFDAQVSTKKVRFLQDAGGGAPSTPNQAFVNEIRAFEGSLGAVTILSYNPAGLLMSESGPAGTKNYGYDWGYRLASYQAGATTASYVTDVLGRRRLKTVGGVTEKYVYAGEDVLADYSASNVLLARYTNGPGIDQKLSMNRSGVASHYVADALGSTHMLLNPAQAVANRYVNDAWGVNLQTTGTVVNRYQYAGRELDAESANYHNRARFYMPGRGVFGQRDPAYSGRNWRWYANDNPMNGKDPWGRDTYFIGGAADYESLLWFGPTEIMGGISPEAQAEREKKAQETGVLAAKPRGVMDDIMKYHPGLFPGKSFYKSHAAVDEMVDEIVASWKPYADKGTSPTDLDKQIVLIGHSWGGASALKVASKLKDHRIGVRLIVTLDMVSQFPVTNPDNQGAWINVYQRQTPVDYIASVPIAGQLVGGILSALNPFDWGNRSGNTIGTLGGQTGYETGAGQNNLKAKLPPEEGGGTLWHGEAGSMLRQAMEERPDSFKFHGGKP